MNPVQQVPFCGDCGKPMRHNVPRLGDAGGWAHAETGSPVCAEIENAKKQQERAGGTCVVCGEPVTDGGRMGNSPIHLECYTGAPTQPSKTPLTDGAKKWTFVDNR